MAASGRRRVAPPRAESVYSAMSTPSKRCMPSGSITKPVTFFGIDMIDLRVGQQEGRGLLLEDHLGLLVELGALGHVAVVLAFWISVLEVLVAPARVVRDADGRAGEQGRKEVVRIAIVAGPADLERARTVASSCLPRDTWSTRR